MDNKLIFNKTRLAPTPSGFLHLGNILSFAITSALAKKTQAKVMLRIDDPDRERTNKIYVQDIFDTLNFLEIPWHEGPRNMQEYEQQYSQLHRMDMYRKALQQLKESGMLFACSCSRTDVLRLNADSIYSGTCLNKKISLDADNVSWRLRTSSEKEVTMNTLEGSITTILPTSMQYFVVRKRDTFPGYQLTSLIDDVHFGIDLIVRGEDLWPSTLAQLYLSTILGLDAFSNATFHHHRLVTGSDGNKLSKSAGDTSVHYLRKEGRQPAHIYAMIAKMLHIDAAPGSWEELTALI